MNIHCDNPDMSNTKHVKKIMVRLDLKQHIDVPLTQLDILLLYTKDDHMHLLLKSISVTDLRISDHNVVRCQLYTSLQQMANKTQLAQKVK